MLNFDISRLSSDERFAEIKQLFDRFVFTYRTDGEIS